jgi:5-methylcytosine-specific restriction endonuclease McrA
MKAARRGASASASAWNAEVKRFGQRVEREWPSFLMTGGSRRGHPQPPPPLVALPPLLRAVKEARPLLAPLLGNHNGLFEFLVWHNRGAWTAARRIRPLDDDVRLAQELARPRGKKVTNASKVTVPLFIHQDAPEHAWVSDPAHLNRFLLRARRSRSAQRVVGTAVSASSAKVPVAVRHAVWNAWMGGAAMGAGPCHVCARIITQQDFECGHVVAASRGGDVSVGNLRPICRSCNRSMGARNLTDFREAHFHQAVTASAAAIVANDDNMEVDYSEYDDDASAAEDAESAKNTT